MAKQKIFALVAIFLVLIMLSGACVQASGFFSDAKNFFGNLFEKFKGKITGQASSVGESCSSNEQCQSGNCKSGVCCVSGKSCCKLDSDCIGGSIGRSGGETYGQKCDSSGYYCYSELDRRSPGSAGAFCTSGSHCSSGWCYQNTCCKANEKCCYKTSDCYSGTCDTTNYYCAASLKSNGQSCSSSSECSSGNCNNGYCCATGKTCCSTNTDCGLGGRCESGGYYCVTTKVNGKTCSSNLDCMSENCNNGICCTAGKTCCTSNSQCSSGYVCSTGLGYYCVSLKANGEGCESNTQCSSGNCKNSFCCDAGKTCCVFDTQCSSLGSGYKCVSGYYCAQSSASGTTAYSNGHACYSNTQCSSGNCKNNVCCTAGKTCCAFNSECSSLGSSYECSSSSFYCVLKSTANVPETSTDKLLEGDNTLDLGLNYAGLKKWDVNIESFTKVGIGIYNSNDLTPNKYGGWMAYVKVNGNKIWENKGANIAYDYAQGKQVTESSYKDQYFDITSYAKQGKNTIEYYHFTDGKHGPKVTVYGGTATLAISTTNTTKKANGLSCYSNTECNSGNCKNNVCCEYGKTCCTSFSDCFSGQSCNSEAYCESIPATNTTKKANGELCDSDIECSTGWCNNGYCCEESNLCCKTNSDCSRIEPVLHTGEEEDAYRCSSNHQCQIPKGVKYGLCDTSLFKCILDKSGVSSAEQLSRPLENEAEVKPITGIVVSVSPDDAEGREVKRIIEEEIYPAIVAIFDKNSNKVFSRPREFDKEIKLAMTNSGSTASWDEASNAMNVPYKNAYGPVAGFEKDILQVNGIAHELVHYHLNGFALKENGDFKKVPLWFREGLAEYGASIYLKEYTSLEKPANSVAEVREQMFGDYLLDKKYNYKETVKSNAIEKISWTSDSNWQEVQFKDHVYYGAAFSFINYFLAKDTFEKGESMMDIAKYMFIMGSKGKFKFYVHVDETKWPLSEKNVKEVWFENVEKTIPGGIVNKLDNKPGLLKRIFSWFGRK